MENKKRIEYYINRLQSLNDKGEDIKLVIEDSLERQEDEYEENNKTENKKIKDMSLVPLFIALILGFNLIIYNIYSEDNICIPFITFFISLFLLYKYVPEKSKKKFVDDFENNINKIKALFAGNNKDKKLLKYISISSDDEKNKLLKDDNNNDNYIESPLLNI